MFNPKLYDSDGNEVQAPEECTPLIGENASTFVKIPKYSAKLVYRPPQDLKTAPECPYKFKEWKINIE